MSGWVRGERWRGTAVHCILFPKIVSRPFNLQRLLFSLFQATITPKYAPYISFLDVCLLDLTCLLQTMYIVHVQLHRYLNYFIYYLPVTWQNNKKIGNICCPQNPFSFHPHFLAVLRSSQTLLTFTFTHSLTTHSLTHSFI